MPYQEYCNTCSSTSDLERVAVVGGYGAAYKLCPSCRKTDTFTCEDCDEQRSHAYHGQQRYQNRIICGSCIDNYFVCYECGSSGRRVDSHYDDESDETYCEDCYTERCEAQRANTRGRRHSYHSRSGPDLFGFLGDPPDKIYFGVELEVETNGSHTFTHIGDLIGDFTFMAEDGSLSSNGVEIISAPASLEYHKTNWKPFFSNDSLFDHGSYTAPSNDDDDDDDVEYPLPSSRPKIHVTDRCGMHVHVSRAPLSSLQIGRMTVFLNQAHNADFITDTAGRTGTTYNHRDPRKVSVENYSGYAGTRSDALNITGSDTVEFRIFAATTRKAIFFKNLEFVHAVVNWSREADNSKLKYEDFVAWLDAERSSYPYLTGFLIARGYMREPVPIPLPSPPPPVAVLTPVRTRTTTVRVLTPRRKAKELIEVCV